MSLNREIYVLLAGLLVLVVWVFRATGNLGGRNQSMPPRKLRPPGDAGYAELLKTRKQIVRQIEELKVANRRANDFSRQSARQLQDILTELDAELGELEAERQKTA